MDVDRLAFIAHQLAARVRDDGAEANQRWLYIMTNPAEREALLYVLAAAVPVDRDWLKLTAWTEPKPDPMLVDEIAVERACRGERIQLNRAEKAVAIERLNRRGLGSRAIAERLGVSARTVVRRRVANGRRAVQSDRDEGLAS